MAEMHSSASPERRNPQVKAVRGDRGKDGDSQADRDGDGDVDGVWSQVGTR